MSSFVSLDLITGWEFKATDDTSPEAWLPVEKVPTVVHLDLMNNKRIPDTSLEMNELQTAWVGEKSWTYRCQFPAPQTSANNNDKVTLLFEGLDTFAHVKLNNHEILESDNMFTPYRIDITSYLQPEIDLLNTLEIEFKSSLLHAREIKNAHPEYKYIAHLGEVDRMGVRKAQYHWGWDWGPVYMTAGPWRPVRLEVWRWKVEDVVVEYELDEKLKACRVAVAVRVEGDVDGGCEVRLRLRNGQDKTSFEERLPVEKNGGAKMHFVLESPELWYPHGYGDQPLYHLDCELIVDDTVIQVTTKRIGFRRAELVQESDSFGKSFYFRVNGVDIFAGGSCWIPADNFIPRISPERYRDWLTLMVESNQVMTRIWGGGIYEEDVFYDVCDELGILVWQDFLFACGSYPTFPSFLDSVEKEARANVRRLRHHPAVVMYAGGNENYYIQETYKLTYDYAGDKDPQSWLKSTFPMRYILEYLLPKVVEEESPGMVYHPDSPWGDGKPILDVGVGDLHQWEVWHGIMRPYQVYGEIGARFNSEFGMQAFPHMSTINKITSDEKERHPQSLTMDLHNKAGSHERRIASYVVENFKSLGADSKYWIYLTQLLQSEAIYYAYRSWRRQWNKPSQRQCGGALVWQLNDCWPAISWAIVDYFLVKKPAFYAIKRALNPIAVSIVRSYQDWTKCHARPFTSNQYDLWIASSSTVELKGAVVQVRFISVRTGLDVLPSERHHVMVQANAITTVSEGIKLDNKINGEDFVISVKLLVNEQVISQDVDWPQPYKYLSFQDRGLKVEVASSRKTIEISALKPVKSLVFEERCGLKLSNNGLDLVPGETYTVDVEGLEDDEILGWTFLGQNEG